MINPKALIFFCQLTDGCGKLHFLFKKKKKRTPERSLNTSSVQDQYRTIELDMMHVDLVDKSYDTAKKQQCYTNFHFF